MKLFVDDCRPAPEGWVLAESYTRAIEILSEGGVEELSLDHDLSAYEDESGTDITYWMKYHLVDWPRRIILH
ncbi:MAG: hypothetical protein FDZ75_03770, partial [Actinobacteria bacterium]